MMMKKDTGVEVKSKDMEIKYAQSAYRTFLFWGICSSLGVTVSTLVDATLVGNFVGSDGLAIANIATPVFLFYSLLGVTLGSGAGVLMGKFLGAAETEKANRIFATVISLGLIVGIFFAIFSVVFRNVLCGFLGAPVTLLEQALQYMTVVFLSAPVFVLYHILSVTVRTDGDPKLTAMASMGVIVTNLGLDILFMKGWNWGLVGASASLCIAELVGCLILLFHFTKKQALLKLHLQIPKMDEIKRFIKNGFGVGSAFIFQALVMLIFNNLLLKSNLEDGVFYVAVFGIMYTMSTIPIAVFDGAGAAASTVISILGGERDRKGMLTVFFDGIRIVTVAGIAIAALFIFFAEDILCFFGLYGGTSIETAIMAFRIYAISLVIAGVNVVTTSFWQTIGRNQLASGLSLLRNFILMLILGFVFIVNLGIIGLAMVYVISEVVCILFVILTRYVRGSQKYIEEKYSVSNRVFERFYSIEAGSMDEVAKNLEMLCEEWDIGYKQSFFINLIVEELIVNIMKFGLNDTKEKCYVSVKLIENEGEYILRIRDNVRSYNPFDLRGDEVDRAAIKVIQEKAKYYDYQRKLVFNYLYVII